MDTLQIGVLNGIKERILTSKEDHKVQILHRLKKRDSVEGSTIGHVLHETRTKIQEIHFTNMSGKIHVNHTWIIDSGASHHTTHLPFILQSIKKLEKPFQIITPIRTTTLVDNMGDVIQ